MTLNAQDTSALPVFDIALSDKLHRYRGKEAIEKSADKKRAAIGSLACFGAAAKTYHVVVATVAVGGAQRVEGYVRARSKSNSIFRTMIFSSLRFHIVASIFSASSVTTALMEESELAIGGALLAARKTSIFVAFVFESPSTRTISQLLIMESNGLYFSELD
jgi:hypothetical protein